MNPYFESNKVEVCNKDQCVRAEGKNADRIAIAASIMLVLIGVGAVVAAVRR